MDSLMEKVVLAVVLAVSLWVLARIVRRSLTVPPDKRGGCCGCPLARECGTANDDLQEDLDRVPPDPGPTRAAGETP